MTHEFALWLSKSFGLFYFLVMAVGVLIYAFWPANQPGFDAAALAILDDNDAPDQAETPVAQDTANRIKRP